MRVALQNAWYAPNNVLYEPGTREIDDDLLDQLPPTATDPDTGKVLNPDTDDAKAAKKAKADTAAAAKAQAKSDQDAIDARAKADAATAAGKTL